MSEKVEFVLDGETVYAEKGQSIWEVANGQRLKIQHLCHKPKPGYRPDGNCRACMVEIEGKDISRFMYTRATTRNGGQFCDPAR